MDGTNLGGPTLSSVASSSEASLEMIRLQSDNERLYGVINSMRAYFQTAAGRQHTAGASRRVRTTPLASVVHTGIGSRAGRRRRCRWALLLFRSRGAGSAENKNKILNSHIINTIVCRIFVFFIAMK